MLLPKLQISKRLAVWTTAVVGALGSGAGAYSVVGNPWAPGSPAAEVASASSENGQSSETALPVPIPDEPAATRQPQRAASSSPPPAAKRRPRMILDPAVAPAAHQSSDKPAGDRLGGDEPDTIRAADNAFLPTPAPTFDRESKLQPSEPKLPEFQPPSAADMQSAWAPNADADADSTKNESAARPAPILAPPTETGPPVAPPVAPSVASPAAPLSAPPAAASLAPSPDSTGSTIALSGSLRQAAQSAIAVSGAEASSGGSIYAHTAPANLAAAPQPALASPHDPPAETASGNRSAAPLTAGEAPARPSYSPSAADESAAPMVGEGDGVPGTEQLDGVQAPSLAVEKIAPPEIQVGKEATFQIQVKNVGTVAAHEVAVLDRVPKGTRFVNATPSAAQTAEGQVMWNIGSLQPGDQTLVSLQVMPLVEGEIGSVAQVVFQAHASARTLCTRPQLSLTHSGPQKVLIGEAVVFDITVSNPGSGVATGVILEEDVPVGLAHEAGRELEFEIGTLRPNETRQLQLTLKADKPGLIQNEILVRGEANLIAQHAVEVEVVAPALEVSLNGPKRRYLERPATYEVVLSNPGTAPAREVEVVTYLPKGMKFVEADHKGQYEPQNHAVYWSLEELPANQTGAAKLIVLPLETGEQKLRLEGRAELGLQNSFEQVVQVESAAELQFSVRDDADPIEIGAEATYLIALTNTGSSAATNVQLSLGLPEQLKPLGGDGPTRVVVEDGELRIDPLARIGPGEEAVYKIKVQGQAAGAQRVQVQLITGETPIPVTREEITRVYADN